MRFFLPVFLTAVVSFLTVSVLQAQAPDAGTTNSLYVSTGGSDGNPGTSARPLRTIQRAVDRAGPATSILVHAGTYREVVRISKSGRAGGPVTIKPAGDGPVTIQPSLPSVRCSAISPTRDRAIQILDGADHWTLSGLRVVGGILIAGDGNVDEHDWLNRSLPGRGMYDPEAAKTTLSRLGVNPADDIRLLNNKVTRRGIFAKSSRFGLLVGNEVSDTECGSGAAVVLSAFSDFWNVRDNYVHDTEPTPVHFMSEGIRLSNASMYNLVENNLVEDLRGLGRGITNDANAGWNVFRHNLVRRANVGFSEQQYAWGNQWQNNLAEDSREGGFTVAMKYIGLSRPTDPVPAYLVMQCNLSRKDAAGVKGVAVGAVQSATFDGNGASLVLVGSSLRSYWRSVGDTWNGRSEAPPANRGSTVGAACTPGLSAPSRLPSAAGQID